MAPYEYKYARWSSTDADEPIDLIQQETDVEWEFHMSVPLHDGAVDLIFRRETGAN